MQTKTTNIRMTPTQYPIANPIFLSSDTDGSFLCLVRPAPDVSHCANARSHAFSTSTNGVGRSGSEISCEFVGMANGRWITRQGETCVWGSDMRDAEAPARRCWRL